MCAAQPALTAHPYRAPRPAPRASPSSRPHLWATPLPPIAGAMVPCMRAGSGYKAPIGRPLHSPYDEGDPKLPGEAPTSPLHTAPPLMPNPRTGD